MKSALISIKPQYIDSILKGIKTVEIRKKPVRMTTGTQLWLYATRPYGRIVAHCNVSAIVRNSPETIWKLFSEETGISYDIFSSYVEKTERITAISFDQVKVLKNVITLEEIKRTIPTFHPPQFLKYIQPETALYKLLRSTQTLP